jgi:hypothetical protein
MNDESAIVDEISTIAEEAYIYAFLMLMATNSRKRPSSSLNPRHVRVR